MEEILCWREALTGRARIDDLNRVDTCKVLIKWWLLECCPANDRWPMAALTQRRLPSRQRLLTVNVFMETLALEESSTGDVFTEQIGARSCTEIHKQ